MIQQESTYCWWRQELSRGIGNVAKGIVTAVDSDNEGFNVYLYTALGEAEAQDGFCRWYWSCGVTYTALAYGSEFAKGTGNFTDKIDPSYSTYENSPIIMKEHYAINGSDTGQIGWIEVTSENGASGYLWYVKAEHENRLRWEDYLEMSMIEGVKAGGTTTGALHSFKTDFNDLMLELAQDKTLVVLKVYSLH